MHVPPGVCQDSFVGMCVHACVCVRVCVCTCVHMMETTDPLTSQKKTTHRSARQL